jgi:hypothetical protein
MSHRVLDGSWIMAGALAGLLTASCGAKGGSAGPTMGSTQDAGPQGEGPGDGSPVTVDASLRGGMDSGGFSSGDAGPSGDSGPPSDGGCTALSFVSGSVSPSHVAAGGSYTVLCNYGSVNNAIDTNLENSGSWGMCTFVEFMGNAAQFNCVAGTTPGTYPATCILGDYAPGFYCARTDPAGSITIGSGSGGSDGGAVGNGMCSPGAAGPGGAGAANVPGSNVPAFPTLSNAYTVTGLDASGNNDVGPAIQQALNAHSQIIIPGSGSFGSPNRYNVVTQVSVPDGAIIECETGAEFLDSTPCTGNMTGLFVWSGTASVAGAGMYGCMFKGTAQNISVPTSYNHSFMRLQSANNFTIEGNYTTNSCGDADIRLDGPESQGSQGSTGNTVAFNDMENAENGIAVINGWNNLVMCNTAYNGGSIDEEPNHSYPQVGHNTFTKNYNALTMTLPNNFGAGMSVGGNGTSCPSGSGVCAIDTVTDNVSDAHGFGKLGIDCECNVADNACDNAQFGGVWSGNLLLNGVNCGCGGNACSQ